eukprot:scpid102755/ scgid3027/ 
MDIDLDTCGLEWDWMDEIPDLADLDQLPDLLQPLESLGQGVAADLLQHTKIIIGRGRCRCRGSECGPGLRPPSQHFYFTSSVRVETADAQVLEKTVDSRFEKLSDAAIEQPCFCSPKLNISAT